MQRWPQHQKLRVFTQCRVCDSGCAAVTRAMMEPDSNGGTLGGAGSAGSLIPIGEWVLSVGIHVNDPYSSISGHNLFPQCIAPETGV